MKILQIVHSFPPYTMAGTEVYSYNLSKALAADNKISVFFRISNPEKEEYSIIHTKFEGLDCYAINNTFKLCDSFKDTYQNAIVDYKFGQLLDILSPDVVHIHHFLFLSHGIIDEIKKRGIPIVFTLHDYWLMCYRGQLVKDDMAICGGPSVEACGLCLRYFLRIRKYSMRIYRWLRARMPASLIVLLKKPYLIVPGSNPLQAIEERGRSVRALCSKIDMFISPSQFVRDKFIEWGLPEEKILFSSHGFDYKNFNPVPKTRSGMLRFAYMGTLLPMKGLDILIEAFKEIKTPDIELSVYGKAFSHAGFETYPGRLRKMIKDDKRIGLKGAYNNNEIGDILRNIDVLVVPSIWLENSPLIIHEAFLSKTPVIASNIGGIPELIKDGVNGLLFKAGNKRDLRKKIEEIIENPSLLDRFSRHAPKVKNIEDNAEEMEELYSKFIGLRDDIEDETVKDFQLML